MTSTFDPQRVRAICFDVDGTLSDTDDLAVRRLSRFLRPVAWLRGEPAAQRLARRMVMAAETPLNQLYEATDRLGIDAFLFQLVHALRKVFPSRAAQYLLIPGVETMLATLSTRYPLAIVSARPRASTLAFLDHFGLRPYFGDCIATAETCERTKPDPSPLLWAAKCMGVPPEACLMVGDTTVDIRAGKAAGAQTVGVLCGFGEEGELRRAGADLILPSTADLPNYLP
ncbi:MAG: HAD family hydrolase [Chloroflexi bacterium]|nr:HAD family hydrolase [Chloroflexota bacterium]